jgi:hypothetical protein
MKGILIQVGIHTAALLMAMVIVFLVMKLAAKKKGGCGCGGSCGSASPSAPAAPAAGISNQQFETLFA